MLDIMDTDKQAKFLGLGLSMQHCKASYFYEVAGKGTYQLDLTNLRNNALVWHLWDHDDRLLSSSSVTIDHAAPRAPQIQKCADEITYAIHLPANTTRADFHTQLVREIDSLMSMHKPMTNR